jgi:hypothetical protein
MGLMMKTLTKVQTPFQARPPYPSFNAKTKKKTTEGHVYIHMKLNFFSNGSISISNDIVGNNLFLSWEHKRRCILVEFKLATYATNIPITLAIL